MSGENKKPRNIPLYIRVSQDEYDIIQNRMAELGTKNLTAFARKMLLNGYVLNVDISPIKELVSLQRRCANNLNQVAVHANTHGIYQNEITGLQKDYNALWEPLSELIKQLTKVVEL